MKNTKYEISDYKANTPLKKWICLKSKGILDLYGISKTTICFSEKKEKINDFNGSVAVFSVNYNKIYKTINLNIYEVANQMWTQGNKEVLLHSLIHEFAHVLTTDIANAALSRHVTKKDVIDRVEELTESIAIMARELYNLKNIN